MKLFKTFAAAALSATFVFGALASAEAMPLPAAPVAKPANADVTNVQYRRYYRGGYYGRHDYYGHRGYYRDYHRGYRRHNDAWVPLAAFGAGALIGGAVASQPRYVQPAPVYSGGTGLNPRHYDYCAARYRSYDPYSNTFQPYNGPRQVCTSPYY